MNTDEVIRVLASPAPPLITQVSLIADRPMGRDGVGFLRSSVSICVHLWFLIVLTGCGAPPRASTTFLGSVDLVAMTDAMAASFAAHPTISGRSASAPAWVISIDRVTNHTNQIIPEREKWLYVARLRAVLGVSRLADERAITWIMPPERWDLVQDELGPAPPELRLTPTHVLAATFAALTNTSGRGRSDAYLCEYQLIDLATGALVWTDAWEVKRAQTGVTYD